MDFGLLFFSVITSCLAFLALIALVIFLFTVPCRLRELINVLKEISNNLQKKP